MGEELISGYDILDILTNLVLDSPYCLEQEQEILNFIEDIREALPLIFGSI